ncbi:HNH endonuclease signature motif containing protein [Cryobacterium aureum]|uniref:HNH endonuclease signature motif containing protein n=1 Tax=Cryobacterium aureum TaxID=995037 RepID=UPI000CF4108C|nr:HNH endonuclease signature motif containing protein [Cryobacterium aureum]
MQVIVTEHDRPTTIPAPSTAEPSATASPRLATPADAPVTTQATATAGTQEAQAVGTAERSEATKATPSTRPSPAAIGTGAFGYLEGNPAPVSAETIARHLCDTGYRGILFDQAGQPLNVGRDARLFNREQRRALAARDGGCRWPGCDQPPSWSEAHHVENWADLGFSNIDQAILLCVLHHLLLHNRHWKILLLDEQYWWQPAVEIDPEQTLIALPSKNPLMQRPLRLDPTAESY